MMPLELKHFGKILLVFYFAIPQPLFAGGIVSAEPVRFVPETICLVSYQGSPEQELDYAGISIGRESGDTAADYPEPRLTVSVHGSNGHMEHMFPSLTQTNQMGNSVYELKRYRSLNSKTIGHLILTNTEGVLKVQDRGLDLILPLEDCYRMN